MVGLKLNLSNIIPKKRGKGEQKAVAEKEKKKVKTVSNGELKQPASSQTQTDQTTKPLIKDPVQAIKKHKLSIADVIAPETLEVDFDYLKINNVYLRTIFVSGYPRYVSPGWL